MTKNKKHHIIPRVYLKNFVAQDTTKVNHVYCVNAGDPYNNKPQLKGIGDIIFCEENFYRDRRLENPLSIEETLGQNFECNFDEVIQIINREQKLSEDNIGFLMTWLYISQMRSPILRAVTKNTLGNVINLIALYNKYSHSDIERKQMDEYIKVNTKDLHLDVFSEKVHVETFAKNHLHTFANKQWKILKSNPSLQFLTNDNPGFSVNENPLFAKDNPFHSVMQIHYASIIYFVLTPQYCIELTPFPVDTPETVHAFSMDIKYHDASIEMIKFINTGVLYTKHKLLIANSLELITKYLPHL